MNEEIFDVAIIGSGPGGYVAAIRAAQLGLNTICIEKDNTLGGTCLNVGCIPSKALLHSSELYDLVKGESARAGVIARDVSYDFPAMQQRKEAIVKGLVQGIGGLFKRSGVHSCRGNCQFIDDHTLGVTDGELQRQIKARHFIIATGSEPIGLPFLPFDEQKIVSSSGALNFPQPPKRLLVIGAGVIGVELASVFNRLGSEVTIIEMLDNICPAIDQAVGKLFLQALKKQGLTFYLGAKVLKGSVSELGVSLEVQQQEEIFTFQGDAVLVAVGRRPYTSGLGLEKIGVAVTNKGFIEVDGNFRSSLPHILAIGDVIEGAMLAHRASGEGIAAAEVISGRHPHVNYIAIPNVIYTNPEVATVGLSDSEARNLGLEILVGNAFFKGNPRARCIGAPEGLIKVVAEAETQRLIGVHMMGPQVSEMIGQGVIALNTKATLSDIVYSSHAHPTLSEAFLDSCLNALGRPIH